jgi:CBS domain containing-hemolysin-like protein
MYHFRNENIQFAMVVDEYGGTAGCVSADDVIEWIAGDVPDERDQPLALLTEKLGDDCYRVSGNLCARLWAERFAVRQVDRHIDTVGGLVVAKLGRVPRAGDSVRIRNLELTVESVSKRRIERILVRRIVAETPDEERRA